MRDQNNNGIIQQDETKAGLYGLLGDWITWLDFNISRIINNPENSEEFEFGMKEASNTLSALPIVSEQFPTLIKTIYCHF